MKFSVLNKKFHFANFREKPSKKQQNSGFFWRKLPKNASKRFFYEFHGSWDVKFWFDFIGFLYQKFDPFSWFVYENCILANFEFPIYKYTFIYKYTYTYTHTYMCILCPRSGLNFGHFCWTEDLILDPRFRISKIEF